MSRKDFPSLSFNFLGSPSIRRRKNGYLQSPKAQPELPLWLISIFQTYNLNLTEQNLIWLYTTAKFCWFQVLFFWVKPLKHLHFNVEQMCNNRVSREAKRNQLQIWLAGLYRFISCLPDLITKCAAKMRDNLDNLHIFKMYLETVH